MISYPTILILIRRNTSVLLEYKVLDFEISKQAWAVVKSLNGSARAHDGKTLVFKGREYVSDKAKASAFIQNMPPSVDGRVIGRAGGLYENSEVVFVDYLAPLDKGLSRPLPLKIWRPP